MAEYSIILALSTAAVAGLVGSFALMRRMTLAGDVMSHLTLPGLALALSWHFHPILGAALTLFAGALLIWKLEGSTSLSTDSAIGVIFVAAVAIGVLFTPGDELVEALFGGFTALDPISFAVGMAAVLLIAAFIYFYRSRLILSIFSPELAAASGVRVSRISLYYLTAFSLTILLGLRFLGSLLVGALIILPAAVGRQLTHTLSAFLLVSSLVSVASVGLGFIIAHQYNLQLGPVIVTVAAILFLLSLLKKKR